MIPYEVIGHYKPKRRRGSIIGPAILREIAHLSLIPLADAVHGAQLTSIWSDEVLHAEVRRFAQPGGQGQSWHQDGDLANGSTMDHAAVLWAAVCPTEFKISTCPKVAKRLECTCSIPQDCGNYFNPFSDADCCCSYPLSEASGYDDTVPHIAPGIYQPKPFEIIIARNLNGHHRTPPNVPKPPTRRWFFRQRVEVPSFMEIS